MGRCPSRYLGFSNEHFLNFLRLSACSRLLASPVAVLSLSRMFVHSSSEPNTNLFTFLKNSSMNSANNSIFSYPCNRFTVISPASDRRLYVFCSVHRLNRRLITLFMMARQFCEPHQLQSSQVSHKVGHNFHIAVGDLHGCLCSGLYSIQRCVFLVS